MAVGAGWRQFGASDGYSPFLSPRKDRHTAHFVATTGAAGCILAPRGGTGAMLTGVTLKDTVWLLAVLLAAAAGYTDWRWRRIPNWLTVPGLILGIAANAAAWGWGGAKGSLLGAGLGLALLLPLVLVRSLGAGDWKLVGALGAFLGPEALITVLAVTILVAGVMAAGLVVWKKRVRQTLKNIGRIVAALATLHLPGPELSLGNPESAKVPFGVAVAVAVILYAVRQAWEIR